MRNYMYYVSDLVNIENRAAEANEPAVVQGYVVKGILVTVSWTVFTGSQCSARFNGKANDIVVVEGKLGQSTEKM